LTIAGKRVRVAYCKPGEDCCARCCFSGGKTCVGLVEGEEWPCGKFDLATAYFVEAEQPEEAPARPANPLVPDQGLTIDGKRYVKRYFRIGDACRRCAFKVGEDANGHAFCKDHGKPEKPCTPDREKGVLVYFTAADQLQEEIHSLQEWAKIMAERPDLRAEFDKMCPPQPIQGSIAPEADVNKWAVTNAFLHCEKAGKIVSEMYGDKLNNPRNRDKYLAFLQQVNLDDRFGELSEILRRYGAMPAPKEQPEADLEAEISRFEDELHGFEGSSRADCINIARHFAEWGAEHLKK
ncbi:MAG: hypothetical protein J6V72_00350, partial [Kiritimatiellae bacterium]|nr:hypothetical protein [Kiritimatiellia bacterium]